MKIENLKNKVKILLEYPNKLIEFGSIYKKDLDKLHLKVILKNGKVIFVEEIELITFAVKEQKGAKK